MTINQTKFGIAGALASIVLWVICSVLVWVLPSMMMNMTGSMIHSDWSQMGWHLSIGGFVIGLIAWALGAGIFCWLLAVIYNRLLD